jgi:hypothetical protein
MNREPEDLPGLMVRHRSICGRFPAEEEDKANWGAILRVSPLWGFFCEEAVSLKAV